MTQEEIIKKIKFVPFLRRELSLLTASVVIRGYTNELKTIIGFGFKNLCYICDSKINESFRTQAELNKYIRTVKDILVNNHQRSHYLLNNGLNLNKLIQKKLKQKSNYSSYSNKKLAAEAKKIVSLYIRLFLFSTILPYEMGKSIDKFNINTNSGYYKNINTKIHKLRVESFYSAYEEKIFGDLFREVAKRKNIKNYRLLSNLTYDEIYQFVSGNLNITEKDLKNRNFFVNIVANKIKILEFGKNNYDNWSKIFIPNTSANNIRSIKGNVAYPGKIKGKVRVLLSRKDIATFKHGEILVTISSNPEFMSAIRKSSAIIADEGGVTCHAAVISRELKKPCIIAAKIATKILKTGDKVEIDANKGIIKIL